MTPHDRLPRLQHWLDARVHAMFLVRSWGFDTSVRDWPPVWEVPIPLSRAEADALRLLAFLAGSPPDEPGA